MKVYYLVYKLTNLVNGKIYIGCHMTKNLDDGYMGSGKRLGYAKEKYGIENFKKEILSIHETPEEMFTEESKIVNEEFLKRNDIYNLTVGGKGGWFIVQQTRCNLTSQKFLDYKESGRLRENAIKALKSTWTAELASAKSKENWKNNREFMLIISDNGRKAAQSTEAKEKRRQTFKEIGHQQGEKNAHFGTMWMYHDDLKVSKRFKKDCIESQLSLGWKVGRKMKF